MHRGVQARHRLDSSNTPVFRGSSCNRAGAAGRELSTVEDAHRLAAAGRPAAAARRATTAARSPSGTLLRAGGTRPRQHARRAAGARQAPEDVRARSRAAAAVLPRRRRRAPGIRPQRGARRRTPGRSSTTTSTAASSAWCIARSTASAGCALARSGPRPTSAAQFTLESYLRSGQRHVEIEPDVAVAHATVAHALRRAGKPELALRRTCAAHAACRLCRGATGKRSRSRCCSATPMRARGCGARLSRARRQPRWDQRATTPSWSADVLGG